jgi:hypothetical protein
VELCGEPPLPNGFRKGGGRGRGGGLNRTDAEFREATSRGVPQNSRFPFRYANKHVLRIALRHVIPRSGRQPERAFVRHLSCRGRAAPAWCWPRLLSRARPDETHPAPFGLMSPRRSLAPGRSTPDQRGGDTGGCQIGAHRLSPWRWTEVAEAMITIGIGKVRLAKSGKSCRKIPRRRDSSGAARSAPPPPQQQQHRPDRLIPLACPATARVSAGLARTSRAG